MSSGAPAKPARPGQMNVIWGLLLSYSVVFCTFLPFGGNFKGTLAVFRALMAWHPVFLLTVFALASLGGISLGKLMGGGTKIGDMTKFTDSDKV